jgi:hypothetical protein
MDRRTWLKLLGVLSATPAAQPQGRGGQAQQPLRITKEQVSAALFLLGLEFQDAEIEMMQRRVNQALGNYESLRKVEVPYGTEPAFTFIPGIADRLPAKGAIHPPLFEPARWRRRRIWRNWPSIALPIWRPWCGPAR